MLKVKGNSGFKFGLPSFKMGKKLVSHLGCPVLKLGKKFGFKFGCPVLKLVPKLEISSLGSLVLKLGRFQVWAQH